MTGKEFNEMVLNIVKELHIEFGHCGHGTPEEGFGSYFYHFKEGCLIDYAYKPKNKFKYDLVFRDDLFKHYKFKAQTEVERFMFDFISSQYY